METLRTDASSLSTEVHECRQNYNDMSATVVKQVSRIAKVEAATHEGAADNAGMSAQVYFVCLSNCSISK